MLAYSFLVHFCRSVKSAMIGTRSFLLLYRPEAIEQIGAIKGNQADLPGSVVAYLFEAHVCLCSEVANVIRFGDEYTVV